MIGRQDEHGIEVPIGNQRLGARMSRRHAIARRHIVYEARRDIGYRLDRKAIIVRQERQMH
ncbi:hypothetical protein D3C87_2090240 [compost metagenome]